MSSCLSSRWLARCGVAILLIEVLQAAEFAVYRTTPENKVVEAGRIRLRSPETCRLLLKRYHAGYDFAVPRSGMTPEQRKQAIQEAKKHLLTNKAAYDKVYNARNEDPKWYVDTTTILNANIMVGGILASMGGKPEIDWLIENFGQQYWIGGPISQIMIRHGIAFDAQTKPSQTQILIAQAMARKRSLEAARWLHHKREEIDAIGQHYRGDLMCLMALNQLEEADAYALECLNEYRGTMTAETMADSAKVPWNLINQIPWAIAHLQARGNEEVTSKAFEGILLHDNAQRDIMMMISEDPRLLLDLRYGTPDFVEDYKLQQIATHRYPRSDLRAAFVEREQAQFMDIEEHLKTNLREISFKNKLFPQAQERSVINLFTMNMAIDLSPLQVSSTAAEYAQMDSGDSVEDAGAWTYHQSPWVMLEWQPELIGRYMGDKNVDAYKPSCLAPFDHQRVRKALLEGEVRMPSAAETTVLWHRTINESFKTPNLCDMAGIHSVVRQLPGEFAAVGMHSLIRTVVRQKGDQLLVGIKVDSKHVDKGGLASAIGQIGDQMAVFYQDSCRKQISNVRWECGEQSGVLEFSRTTDKGLHFFDAKLPKDNLQDVHLYFDWEAPGTKQTLGHALYEPLFGL